MTPDRENKLLLEVAVLEARVRELEGALLMAIMEAKQAVKRGES